MTRIVVRFASATSIALALALPAAAELKIETLEAKLPGRHRETPFEEIWPGMEPPYHGTTGTSFSVETNQPGFLSLKLYYSYLAAYPSSGSRNYNFDARTGEPIVLRRIFTPEGLVLLRKQVVRARLQRIDDFLAGKEVDGYGTKLRSDPEIAAEQKWLYGQCREFGDGHRRPGELQQRNAIRHAEGLAQRVRTLPAGRAAHGL